MVDRAERSFTNISKLAAAAENPELKACSDFFLSQLQALNVSNARLEAVKAIEATEILDRLVKSYLVAQLTKEATAIDRQALEVGIRKYCAQIPGHLLINLISDYQNSGLIN